MKKILLSNSRIIRRSDFSNDHDLVCGKQLSHMGENSGNSYLVCGKTADSYGFLCCFLLVILLLSYGCLSSVFCPHGPLGQYVVFDCGLFLPY